MKRLASLVLVGVMLFAVQSHATLKISTTTRNAMLDAITTAIGSSGLLRIYDGTQPANCGTATNKLAELALTATAAPAASLGVLTFSAITQDSSADNTGTATWYRVTTSGGTCIYDGTVGTSGADLNLNTVSIVAAAAVAVTALTVTAGNS